MKIIIEKGKEKNIPKRCESFFNPQLMEDWTKKRLTKKERLNLEFEYVKSNLSKYELEFIGNSKPVSVNAVQTSSEIIPVGGNYLTDAVNWFKENDIELYGIQTNPTQHEWTHSPKAYCQLYIDDAGLGMPLMTDLELSKRPYVDWDMVELMLFNAKIL
jgi:hypothetical protein